MATITSTQPVTGETTKSLINYRTDAGVAVIEFVVADTGSGISKEHMTRIFEPFFTTKKDVGTGLGLWIVKSMLVEAGGFIRCRSRVSIPEGAGSGTVMMVFLPSESGKASRNQEAAA